jgi:hypothetical protein
MTHASIPAERRAELGLSDTLIRLSPGLEHADDLIEDLIEGLTATSTHVKADFSPPACARLLRAGR